MNRKWRIIIGVLAGIVLVSGVYYGLRLYTWIYRPSLIHVPQDSVYLFVHTGWKYEDVEESFREKQWLRSTDGFKWVAEKKNYPRHIHPGRYLLRKNMTNPEIINLLRSGQQSEVNLVFNTMRTFEYLSEVISKQLEPDSLSFIQALRDTSIMQKYGYEPRNWFAMFIPNTYRFYWNTSVEEFLDRMSRESQEFWNPEREVLRKSLGFTRNEVITLASIVQEETFKVDEMPRVAGVYVNRLERGIPLQADPTIIFAHGDLSMRRVLRKHLSIRSPYNTYVNRGLPPGPIRIPSIQAIDATLAYEEHDYLYFCAREDFSGYHAFARTYREHLRNARKYRRALDERGIFN